MTNFFSRSLCATASPVAIGLMLLAGAPARAADPAPDIAAAASAAAAQEAQPTEPTTDAASPAPADEPGEEAVIVTGFRASLQSAVRTKKKQDQIVESVSAEDIGKLPDNSIGEAIARLPGLAAQRTNGRANVIAIRGFGPDFSQTTLNGREQTSTGDSRGVEFDQYPSEVVSQVVVYKSPSASLTSQGLVGTVDIRTIRPLDAGKRIIAVGARGSVTDLGKLNADSNDTGYRANAIYVDQFADGNLGVSLAASLVDEPYQQREYGAWGFFEPFGDGNQLFSGAKVFATSTQLKRFGLNGTIQAKASDNITLTGDGFYSDFKDDQLKRALEMPVSWFGTNGNPADFTARDDTFVSGVLRDVQAVVRNDAQERTAKLYSFGLNAAWNNHDGWTGFLDFGWSRTNRRELSIQSTAGTGYNWDNPFQTGDEFAAADPVDDIAFTVDKTGPQFDPTLDYSDPDLILLTDPLGWGGGNVQAGYINDRKVKDDLKQYRAELERAFEGTFISSVKAGVSYIDRGKTLRPEEFFLIPAGGATEIRIPDKFLQDPTDIGRGLGEIVTFDPRDLINAGILQPVVNTGPWIYSKSYDVTEKLLASYVQANILTQIGSTELTGNVGAQLVHTDQSSDGVSVTGGGVTPFTDGAKYWTLLPSMNLAARMPNDIVIRFAASRQMQRARLDQMRAALDYYVDTSQTPYVIGGNAGNPRLKPFMATAVDLNFEKYFATKGYVALQLFYKDIDRFIFDGRSVYDYSDVPPPSGPAVPSPIGYLNQPVNTKGGHLYGFEAAGTLPFGVIAPALDGFGLTGGVSYTKSKVKDPNGNVTEIPGYSKWVANATAFYENRGFNIRGSVRHRSRFLGDFVSYNGNPDRRSAIPETIVDGQVGYDFQPGSSLAGLSVYLQGQNLTDEPFKAVNSNYNMLQTWEYQQYGRRFLAGFTYKFR